MINTLKIVKESEGVWFHIPNGVESNKFAISSFEISLDGNVFKIVEIDGATRYNYLVQNITVQDQSTGWGIETFISPTILYKRLKQLDYTPFFVYVSPDIGAGKENLSNKQNSLAIDGTGIKYPTVDAVNSGLNNKVSGSGAVETLSLFTGTNTIGNSVITQFGNNIGINRTSPTGVLEVVGPTNNGISYTTINGITSYLGATGGAAQVGTTGNNSLEFLINSYAAASITANGNFIITSGTDNGVDRLQVNGTISANPATLPNQVVIKSQLDAAVGGTAPIQLKDFYVDVNNSLLTETDLYTYTLVENRFNVTGEKVIATYGGTFNDATASSQLKVVFAGQTIGDTGALTMSVTGAWIISTSIIRTGTTTARSIVNISTPGASTASYTKYTSLTGLDFTNTKILKITGTASGVSGGDNDITASYGNILWQPAAL